VFLDESGFMLQPVCRRTWAPRGQTPVLRQWDRRDRLSVISALSLAPRRRRFGLYWTLHRHNIRSAEVLRFLQALRRHLPRGFTLIWDRHRPHRAARVATWLHTHRRIVVEWLPAYAPDLNPVEPVWSHTKYGDLANFAPDDLATLEGAVLDSLTATRRQRSLLAACFQAADLEL
jgi:transposase